MIKKTILLLFLFCLNIFAVSAVNNFIIDYTNDSSINGLYWTVGQTGAGGTRIFGENTENITINATSGGIAGTTFIETITGIVPSWNYSYNISINKLEIKAYAPGVVVASGLIQLCDNSICVDVLSIPVTSGSITSTSPGVTILINTTTNRAIIYYLGVLQSNVSVSTLNIAQPWRLKFVADAGAFSGTSAQIKLSQLGYEDMPNRNNFSVRLQNNVTGAWIQNYSAIINGTFFNNARYGEIITPIQENINENVPIIYSLFSFYNQSVTAVNTSVQRHNGSVYPFVINFSNYVRVSNLNYTRILSWSIPINYCYQDAPYNIFVNESLVSTTTQTCTTPQNLSGSYQSPTEGNYSIRFEAFNGLSTTYNFTSDLYAPIISYVNITGSQRFNSSAQNTNVSMQCYDSIAPNLLYNLTYNNIGLFYGNKTNNSVQLNQTSSVDGLNTAYAFCSDFLSNTTLSRTESYTQKILYLIDEMDNVQFLYLANLTSARAYIDDNSSYWDFKTTNTTQVNFTALLNQKLRIEFIYPAGSTITRYLDTSIINQSALRICVNKQGVTHYEQLALSNTQKEVLVYNPFATCYIAADYTRFAYQDRLSLRFYTISANYYVYTLDNNSQTLLASLDGTSQSFIDIDALEFGSRELLVNFIGAGISGQKSTAFPGFLVIRYTNEYNDNIGLRLQIRRLDTQADVFDQSVWANYNNVTLMFDYSALFNVTNETIFRVTATGTKEDGRTEVISRYIGILGQSGILSSGWAFALAFMLLVFGLTFTSINLTFGWFGAIVSIIAIVITSLSVQTWYILLLQVMSAMVLVYCILIFWLKNYKTVEV